MKKLFITILAATIGLASCREDDITDTVKKCNSINEHLSEYKPKSIDLTGITDQNGSVTGYFKNNEMVMASVKTFGESGRKADDYYFEDEKLIAVNKEEFIYNQPKYMTEEVARKSGDSVWYDDKKTVMKNSRYYFYDDRLVKWIGPNKKEIPENDRRYQYTGATLLNEGDKLLKMLKDQN